MIKKPKPLNAIEYHHYVLQHLELRIDEQLSTHIDLHPNQSTHTFFIYCDNNLPFQPTHMAILEKRYEDEGWQMEWVPVRDSTGLMSGYRITFE